MATISKVATLVSGFHLVLLASPPAFAQKTPDANAPLAAPLPAAHPTAADSVWVRIEGSDVAELQRDTGDHKHFETVCTAPCEQAVSTSYAYRIGGEGIRNSRVFRLHGDRETLSVDEGSKTAFVLGIVGVSVGGAATLAGCLVLLIDGIVSDAAGSTPETDSVHDLGLGLVVVGLAGVIGGAFAIGSNAHTSVTQDAPAPAAAWLPAIPDTRREAGWAPRPATVSIPILSGRF
jgi:hypothetical protein